MEVRHHEQLSVGWKVGSIDPPELSLTVIAKAVCPLTPRRLALASSPPGVRGDRFAVDGRPDSLLLYPSDLVPFKPNTDVLIAGHAHTPGGKPDLSVRAGVSIAGIRKTLLVIGDRRWTPVPGDESRRVISPPEPFVSMPLTRARSFGGTGFVRNPLGTGFGNDRLPNIEDPARLIAARDDTPDPVTFGPIPADHYPRAAMLGTYDESYAKARWPWLPADFDWRHFNAAPIDQQADGFLRGDELLRLRNLVPGEPDFRTHLPGVRVRWLMLLRDRLGDYTQRDIDMNLDTVFVDTDAGEVTLVWRGVTPVPSMKLREVEFMYAAVEPRHAKPASTESHWEEFDAKSAAETAPPPEMAEQAAEGRAHAADLEAKADKLRADAHAKRDEAMATAESMKAEKAARDASAAALRAELAEDAVALAPDSALGGASLAADSGTVRAAAATASGPASHPPPIPLLPAALPPSPLRARIDMLLGNIENLRFHGVPPTDPRIVAITGAIAKLESLDAERGRSMITLTRLDVLAAAARKDSLERLSMSSLDLSGIDLSGLDLRSANLTEANLAGAKFVAADLTGAILYKADLTGADLTDATCDEAVFIEATIKDAAMTGLSVAGTKFNDLDFRGKLLTGWKGNAPMLNGAKLDDAVFKDAKIPGAMFMKASMHRVDLAGADLTNADLLGVTAECIGCSGANLSGVRASPGVSMRFGDFTGARVFKASFNGANLEGCDFTGAYTDHSNFSEASLSHAIFRRSSLAGVDLSDADLTRVRFEDCSLARAMLERCVLDETEFRRVNAWSAGFWLSQIENASFEDCSLKGTALA